MSPVVRVVYDSVMSEIGGSPSPALRVGVIGMGAVGPILAAAFTQAGHTLVGVSARSQNSQERVDAILPGVAVVPPAQLVPECDLVVFTVRDQEIAPLVTELAQSQAFRAGQLVAHVSGAHGLDVLQPAAAAGTIPLALHPAQTFSGTSLDLQRLPGTHWAVNAPRALLAVAQALVLDLGGIPHVLPDSARPLYHAALAHGANHLVIVVSQALRALRMAGLDDPSAYVEPLFKAAFDRAIQEGEAGLSGPVVRGDSQTVALHLNALQDGPVLDKDDLDPALPFDDLADVPNSYRALARAAAQRLRLRGNLSPTQFDQLRKILD